MKLFNKIILAFISFLLSVTLIAMNPDEVLALSYNEFGPYYKETINTLNQKNIETSTNESLQNSLNLNEGEDLELAEERLQGFYEDVSRRDAYTKVYISDTSEEEHLYLYMKEVHEWVNGSWQEVDTSIESTKSRSIEFENNNTIRDLLIDEQAIRMDNLTLLKQESISLVDDNQVKYEDGTEFYSIYEGYILRSKIESMEKGYTFIVSEETSVTLADNNTQVILKKEGELEAVISLKSVHTDEETISSINLQLENLENNTYKITLDSLDITTYAGFDVDVEVKKTIENQSNVKLWGVRNGSKYHSNSYNPGSGYGEGVDDRVIIGNANYNKGAVFGCKPIEE